MAEHSNFEFHELQLFFVKIQKYNYQLDRKLFEESLQHQEKLDQKRRAEREQYEITKMEMQAKKLKEQQKCKDSLVSNRPYTSQERNPKR